MRSLRRSFWLAWAASLMLHLLVLVVPGWRLPWAADETAALPLDATLILPPREPAPPTPMVPPPRKVAVPRPVAPAALPRVPASREAERPLPPPEPLPTAAADGVDGASPAALPSVDAVPPAPTFSATWPPEGRIRYTVTRGDSGFIVGQAEHRWQHDAVHYQVRATTETVGLAALFRPVKVVQESRGIFVPTGLQPLEFRSERDGQLKQAVRFDPAQKHIFISGGSHHELREPTQDLLSLFYQLGSLPLDLAQFEVMVATGRKVERYTLTLLETLVLETPFGARTVQHLRLPGMKGGESDDSTEIWLDSQTRLPLKIRHRDRKGEVFDQTATAVELGPTE